MDRISEFPEPILHRIIGFLSQNEAVQTSLLSKSWRHLWRTRPIVEFRENLFRGNKETFISIFDQTLQRYHRQNLSIKQFIAEISSFNDPDLILLLEKWIPIVLINLGVETFHFTISDLSPLPSAPVVFHAEFLKELYLEGCRIDSVGEKLCLNHLQTLSLKHVCLKGETLAKIMADCPLMERVDLYLCKGLLTTVKVNNLKHFGCLFSCHTVEINVPSTLETIKIQCCHSLYLDCTNNHHFPRLKSLCLTEVRLSEDFSDIFSCNSSCLEDLELRSCSGFNQVKILSCSVKRLIIVGDEKQIKTITVDAPNLLYFEFSCPPCVSSPSLPSVSFATVVSREWKSNISVSFQPQSSDIDVLQGFLELNEMLKALRQSRITLNLPCDTMRNRHIRDIDCGGYCEPILVEQLDLGECGSFDDFSVLVNYLFRIFLPRYMYMRMSSNPNSRLDVKINKLTKFIWKANLKDGEFSRCFFSQQELKKLSIGILDHDSGHWHLVQGSHFPVCASKKNHAMKSIRFGFEWKESDYNLTGAFEWRESDYNLTRVLLGYIFDIMFLLLLIYCVIIILFS